MQKQTLIEDESFHQMKEEILEKVMKTSRDLIETFEFSFLYHRKVSSKQNKNTIQGLKEWREKHWDTSLSKDEAYKKYLTSD